ncbi:hypothetical protein D038_1877C, partial [Vibrio parahaemolyticus IDH02189]
DAELPNHCNGL